MKNMLGVFFFLMLMGNSLKSQICPAKSLWCGLCSECLENDVPCPTQADQCPAPSVHPVPTPTPTTVYPILEGSLFYCLNNAPMLEIFPPNATDHWYVCGTGSYPSSPSPQPLSPPTQAGYAFVSGTVFSCPGESQPVLSNIADWYNCAVVKDHRTKESPLLREKGSAEDKL